MAQLISTEWLGRMSGILAKWKSPYIVVCLSLITVVYCATLLVLVDSFYNYTDYTQYYVYAFSMRSGQNPYTADQSSVAAALHLLINWNRATYTPTFLLCFEPLTFFSPRTAFRIWNSINIIALAISLYLLLDEFDPLDCLLLACLGILYAPVAWHFLFGQMQIIILLLLILAIRWLRAGLDARAGLVLATACLLRVFPLILMGYLIVRHKWSVVIYASLGIFLGIAITCAFLGVSRTASFAELVSPLSHQLANPTAVSLPALISRLFWLFTDENDQSIDLVRQIAIVLGCIMIAALTVYATATHHSNPDDDDRAFALWVITMVTLTPTAWHQYMVLLLLPFSLLVTAATRGAASVRASSLALASYVFTELSMFPDHKSLVGLRLAIGLSETASLWVVLAYASAYFLLTDGPTRNQRVSATR